MGVDHVRLEPTRQAYRVGEHVHRQGQLHAKPGSKVRCGRAPHGQVAVALREGRGVRPQRKRRDRVAPVCQPVTKLAGHSLDAPTGMGGGDNSR